MLDLLFSKTVGEADPAGYPAIRRMLDRLIEYASESRFAARLDNARALYYKKSGKTNDDDPDFVQRMNTFLEWFIFDYRPDGPGTKSVFDQFLDEKRKEIGPDDMVWWIALSRQIHSMFVIKSSGGGVIKVRDLTARRYYVVTDEDRLEPGDVLEGRIVCVGKGCFFTYTHCLHPKQALKPIRSEMRKYKGKPLTEDTFFKLQGMQQKWRRFRQISIDDIYKV